MAGTLDPDGSLPDLARTILRDLGITSEVLHMANSALFNRSGRPILSVAHAITLLGWDTVRRLLSTIRYVDHFANGSPGVRELMLLSVLNAVHSRDLAIAAGFRTPEEAYVCGLFRNVGEVLIACHCPYEYSQIILAMQDEKISARAACLRYLGFTWDEVGSQVSRAWNMPGQVQQCLGGAAGRFGTPYDACLASVTDYARDLTHALYRTSGGIDSFRLRCVTRPEGGVAPIPLSELNRIVKSAIEETGQTFQGLQIPVERLRLAMQADQARHILESTPVFDAAALEGLDRTLAAARRSIEQKPFELSEFIKSILDAIQAAGFDCAVFGLVNDKHTLVRGRLASGPQAGEVLAHFHFSLEHAEGPILAAFAHRTDVLIDRSRDNRYDGGALVTALQPRAFALFPIMTGGKAVGCLYADRKGPSPGLGGVRFCLARARDTIAAAICAKAVR